jgi:hypothetical protein
MEKFLNLSLKKKFQSNNGVAFDFDYICVSRYDQLNSFNITI